MTLPPVATSPWLPDGLAAVLVVMAIAWFGYVVKQWRDEPERWETWIDAFFGSEATKQGDVLRDVMATTLPDLFDLYFNLRPASELPVDPGVLRSAAAEIEADPDAAPQRSRDLIVRPLANQLQVRLVESMPQLTQALVVLPPMIVYLMTLGCLEGDLERYRRRLTLVRVCYALSGLVLASWLVAIVLTRAYDWTPLALLAPAAVAVVLTLVAEGVRERVRGRLLVRKSLVEMINP
ncbi:MAG: hypothetical protein HY262_04375 [Chloroflexi bacterium]|nr:hypothetical protein [Chloroflexota bacterium]